MAQTVEIAPKTRIKGFRTDGPAKRLGQSIGRASRSAGPADRTGQPILPAFPPFLSFLAYKYPSSPPKHLLLLLLLDQDVPAP